MQYIEHDMDELFQKAAEHYPLKKSENEWDTIAARITRKTVSPPPEKVAGRKKYLLATLFLIFFLLLGGILWKPDHPGRNKFNDISSGGSLNQGQVEQTEIPRNSGPVRTDDETRISPQQQLTYKNIQLANLPNGLISDQPETLNPKETENDMLVVELKSGNGDAKSLFIYADKILTPNSRSFTIQNNPIPALNSPSLNTALHPASGQGIYWGLLAGPQFSQVKRQGITKTGLNLGIVAGYRFNDQVAIESGIFYSARHYYSDGKYFTMSKPDPTMPSNMTLMNIHGTSEVVEFPVKIRLDLAGSGRNRVFGTAGVNSFILTSEKNNYHAMVNGTPEDMARSYHKNSHYAAAGLLFSAGFEHQVLNGHLLRIEPYLQIPLKGIGVGAMPVSSTGIHIGFTRLKRNQ